MVGDVGDDREAADLACDRIHLIAGSGADGNARSCRGELARNALTDSPSAARDEGDLTVELAFAHRASICAGPQGGVETVCAFPTLVIRGIVVW